MRKSLATWNEIAAAMLAIAWVAGCAATSPDYTAILAGPNRPQNERALDATRKPDEVLAFYGVKNGDKVVDILAGRGYYTAILSQVVGPAGVVYSANVKTRPEVTERWKAPEFANVRNADGPLEKLAIPQDGSLDFALIHLNYHDLPPATSMAMNRRVFAAVKRGGVYAVVDHSAKDGAGNEDAKTLHRIDKQLVIKEVTGSGFTLAKEGTMLRKPEDTRDFSVLKVRNRDDRFVLAFVKP